MHLILYDTKSPNAFQPRSWKLPFFLHDLSPFSCIHSSTMRPYLPAVDLLPRHPPCVFPLHWRAFQQRAGIWFRSPNFSGKTVDFSVLFPDFCHRLAVHFPYDCRPFSIIALPLDSVVLGASARKSQWFQENSGSFPYIFRSFSVHLPYFFRTLLDRVEGPIFREAPSSLPASPVPSRFNPMTGGKSG